MGLSGTTKSDVKWLLVLELLTFKIECMTILVLVCLTHLLWKSIFSWEKLNIFSREKQEKYNK